MDFEQFKSDALRTESKPEKLNFSTQGAFVLMSISAEMATLLDLAKKTMFYGKPLDVAQFSSRAAWLSERLAAMSRNCQDIAVPEDDSPFHQPNMRIAHGSIGMFTEAGELLEAVAKQIQTGELDLVNVAEETGDSDWYKAIILDEANLSEVEIREKVIAKLKKRYGDKFSSEAALNRDLDAERAVLEMRHGEGNESVEPAQQPQSEAV